MKAKDKSGAVVPIDASMAPRIEPAEGWQLRTKVGLMAFKEGEVGRLVSICDVFKWMIATRPAADAMHQLLYGLRGLELGRIYQVERDAWARPLTPDTVIFRERPSDGSPQTIYQAATGQRVDCFVSRFGMPALLSMVEKHLQVQAGRPFGAGQPVDVARIARLMAGGGGAGNDPGIAEGVRASSLAVAHATANEVWGWGVAVLDATQASRKAVSPLDALTTSLRDALETEVAKWKAARAASGTTNGARGVAWPDPLRVAVADAVNALNKVQKGSGVGIVAAVMLVSEQAVRSQIGASKVTRSRASAQGLAGNLFPAAQAKR